MRGWFAQVWMLDMRSRFALWGRLVILLVSPAKEHEPHETGT